MTTERVGLKRLTPSATKVFEGAMHYANREGLALEIIGQGAVNSWHLLRALADQPLVRSLAQIMGLEENLKAIHSLSRTAALFELQRRTSDYNPFLTTYGMRVFANASKAADRDQMNGVLDIHLLIGAAQEQMGGIILDRAGIDKYQLATGARALTSALIGSYQEINMAIHTERYWR